MLIICLHLQVIQSNNSKNSNKVCSETFSYISLIILYSTLTVIFVSENTI